MKSYYVYILTNASKTVLYIGVTNDLQRRIFEHKQGLIDGFTKRYKCRHLMYYEETNNIREAIAREKQLKGWTRHKKEDLIHSLNPNEEDLSATF